MRVPSANPPAAFLTNSDKVSSCPRVDKQLELSRWISYDIAMAERPPFHVCEAASWLRSRAPCCDLVDLTYLGMLPAPNAYTPFPGIQNNIMHNNISVICALDPILRGIRKAGCRGVQGRAVLPAILAMEAEPPQSRPAVSYAVLVWEIGLSEHV